MSGHWRETFATLALAAWWLVLAYWLITGPVLLWLATRGGPWITPGSDASVWT